MAFDELLHSIAKLESDIAGGPIVPAVTPQEIRNYLAARYDFAKPLALDDVGADVERMLRRWQVHVTYPRYFGLINPSVTPASVVGDTLAAMYNPQLATWRTSPAANEIERHILAWLTGKLGFHADAAWGGAAILSPRLRSCLAGVDSADSITCDAHKWFSVPMAAGMFFCRHPDAVGAAFRVETSYMPGKTAGGVRDPYTTSVQWSRRFIGLKLFLALAHHGESGYVQMIEHQARMGDVLRASLGRVGWRVVNTTPLPVVCFTRDGLDTGKFLAALYQRQIAWMSEVRLGGGAPVVRACITSFRTTEADIEWVVREMDRLIEVTT